MEKSNPMHIEFKITRRRPLIYTLIVLSVGVMVLAGFFLVRWQTAESSSASVKIDNPTVKLGISYLPVNKAISDYYSLGVDSGALVTEVIQGGLADKAGIKAGDVITSFNGIKLEEGAPLLGAMRSCDMVEGITLEVCYNNCYRSVQITDSSPY